MKSNKLEVVMAELGIPYNLSRLVIMMLKGTISKVKTQRKIFKGFSFTQGVRVGGDVLSALLIYLILGKAVRNREINNGGIIYNLSLAYASDVTLITWTKSGLTERLRDLVEGGKIKGLIVNKGKTLYLSRRRESW